MLEVVARYKLDDFPQWTGDDRLGWQLTIAIRHLTQEFAVCTEENFGSEELKLCIRHRSKCVGQDCVERDRFRHGRWCVKTTSSEDFDSVADWYGLGPHPVNTCSCVTRTDQKKNIRLVQLEIAF